jgi:UMF1 family MFS transporter
MSLAAFFRKPHSPRLQRWTWYLYDFGNSAYASVVVLAVYSAYFKEQVVGGAEGSRLWGRSVAIAMIVVALISPVLGAIADFSATKKRFLLVFTVIACLFTASLFLVNKGGIFIGMLFFILAEIGYRSAQVFYDGLLPEIAAPEEMGSVSGKGWALGSFGGIVILLIILPLIVIFKGTLTVRLSMVLAAVFYALASIPLFLWLPEHARSQSLPAGESYLTIGFRRLWNTFRRARQFREFIKFMVAFLVYNDGVMMALEFAAIIGAVLYGMNQQMLIVFMIIVQATNVVGAYLLGRLVDRIGCRRTLVLAILLMIAAVGWLYFNETLTGYLVIGALTGFAMAGVQSVSRTMVGMISPPGQSAEFFGLFSTVGRTSSFIGPAVYGWIAAEAALYFRAQGVMENLAEQRGIRMAILSIAAFLLLGLLILLSVNEKRARAAARASVESAAVPEERTAGDA